MVCLPHLCEQWQDEIKDKLDLDAVIIRSNTQARLDREIQGDVSVYGWDKPSDAGPALDLGHKFHEVDYLPENDRIRYTIHPDARKEVLKRLLQLNHKLYAEEEAKGLHKKKPGKNKGDDQGQQEFGIT